MDTSAVDLTDKQVCILKHSIGMRDEQKIVPKEPFRNRFVSDPDTDLEALVKHGFMKKSGPVLTMSGMYMYWVVDKGFDYLRRLA